MCGITGITDKQVESLEEGIQKMTRCIAHRGPDEDGFFVDESVALGMRRLSIIDLKSGRQPITSKDERYLIFFNGEIYNYKELRANLADYPFTTESDTEVILAGFIKEGRDFFKRLRGMFAIAIYDTKSRKLILARDPFGIKPLYYWQRNNKIAAFASEIKSILSLKGFSPKVNDAAVYNYLSFQYNPLPQTFFKDVYKLSPGHTLTLDLKTGVYEIESFYQFEFKPEAELSEGEAKNMVLDVMRDSVGHHMIADVPVGSFLSGGIDSSVIATCMQEFRGKKKIKTFTVGFENLSEGAHAKESSDVLGTDHTEINVSREEYFEALPKVVYHFDEPVADPSAVGIYFLAREAKKSVKVVLSGEGSDELFGGYNIYLAPFDALKLKWMPRWALKLITLLPIRGRNYAERALLGVEGWYFGQKYFNKSIFQRGEIRKLWRGAPQEFLSLDYLKGSISDLDEPTKMQYIDINTWLVGDILAKADKMTMAHSLELRVPFLDIEVARVASRLPSSLKWKGREGKLETKWILREAFKSLLPESTRRRKKLGFPVPMAEWLDEENTKEILQNEYIKKNFDRQMIENLLRNPKENARKIYLLLLLSIWYNSFIHARNS